MWISMASVAARAAWPQADVPALDGPLQGLRFGMTVEEVWAAVPQLRDGINVVLEEGTYNDVVTRIPALAMGAHSGGNRWSNTKSRSGSWPAVEGAEWELRVHERHVRNWIIATRCPWRSGAAPAATLRKRTAAAQEGKRRSHHEKRANAVRDFRSTEPTD